MMRRFFGMIGVFLVCSLLLTGCWWKKTTTNTNSTVTGHEKATTTIGVLNDADLLPSNASSTRHITMSGNNVYFSDDGLREVRVKADTMKTQAVRSESATGAQEIQPNELLQDIPADSVGQAGPEDSRAGPEVSRAGPEDAPTKTSMKDLGEQIRAWLIDPQPNDALQTLSVKQASISVGGGSLTLLGAGKRADHLLGHNVTVTASGDDLLIQGKYSQKPYESYLIVLPGLDENYFLNNPSNWFDTAGYLVPKDDVSLFKIQRGSAVQGVSITYTTGKNTYPIARGYEDRYAGFSTLSEETLVPADIPLTITPTFPSTQVTAYRISFDEKTTTHKGLEKIQHPGAKTHLETYAQTNKLGIVLGEPLTADKQGNWQVTTQKAKEQALFIEEPTHSFLLPVHNYPFTVEVQHAGNDERYPYRTRLLTSYMLDETTVKSALTTFFGEKRFEYEPWDKSFTYEIDPQITYTGSLIVRTIFGQETSVDLRYYIESISPKAIVQNIVANQTISIVPRSGTFKDILVQYKNIPSFTVNFQACESTSSPDLLGKYKGVGIESYLFSCEGPTVTKKVEPVGETFTRRKAHRTPVAVPDELQDTPAFKLSFKNAQGQEQVHYMMKSDIGVWTKIADNQLWVRGFSLTSGEPLSAGSVKVTNLEGKNLGTAPFDDGLAKITLPEADTQYDYATQRKKETYLVDVTKEEERAFVVAHKSGRGDVAVPTQNPQDPERYLKIHSKLDISEVTSSSNQVSQRGMIEPVKIYGYTDRGLYKAGETIYFAGRVRNVLRFDSLEYLQGETVDVTLANPMGGEPILISGLSLDTFGGFEGSFDLPKTLPLGEYTITYTLHDNVLYTHNIKVEEYQKPTFFTDISYTIGDNQVNLLLKPTYFFGTPLSRYDAKITRSLAGKDICWYCRRRNDDDYYFNHVFQDTITTGGTFDRFSQTAELTAPLYTLQTQQHKGYQYTLKVDAIVKDSLSDEVQYVTKYIDFAPEVLIGLANQPYERLYRDGVGPDPRTTRAIKGKIDKGAEQIKQLRYEVYRWSYDYQMQQGVDGNLYFINGQGYVPVASGTLAKSSPFYIPSKRIDKPGEYFVRVLAEDAQGTVIGEVQKKIGWYMSNDENNDLLGAVPNNYTLTVQIPKKTYNLGENIPVHITPYQRDAWVVVTVERGQYILDTFLKQLNGNELTIPVKKGYAPNIIVSVMMLQGTEQNLSPRKEPRFFAGYSEVQIDTSMHTLTLDIRTDKPTYAPGDRVTVTIQTKDSLGKLVDARVSVSVIDKALLSLYEILKEPLPYFFNKAGTSVFTYTNMKLLYQSLKAFATGGSKGGGGQGGKAMFSYIRSDLKDNAFWSGAVYTKNGVATVSFIAPENITTWMIDAIGISTDTKLGTASTGFVVKKDLIIEPNAPVFLTIGDAVTVPVKVIALGKGTSGKVTGSARLTNQQGEKKELGTFSVAPNNTLAVPVSVPLERRTSAYVTLSVQGRYGVYKDGIAVTIPLRTEGLISKDTVATINKVGSHTFTTPDVLTKTTHVSLSPLPTNLLDPIAKRLVHYPYGCTEQILSSLLPLISLQRLETKGLFLTDLLSGGMIPSDKGPVSIDQAIRDGVSKLLTHQRYDGSFGYRGVVGGAQEVPTTSTYLLSVYVYQALLLLQDAQVTTSPLTRTIERLENFLQFNRKLSDEGRYRYLAIKGATGQPVQDLDTLDAISPNDTGYLPLLRYMIAVAQKDTKAMNTRRTLAHLPTNQDQWTEYSVYFNPTTATAMKLRALIDDPQATQQERSDVLLSLMKQRNKEGLRGRNTQNNLQVLLTLEKLALFRKPKASPIVCQVTIDGKQHTLSVTTGSSINLPAISPTTVIERSCDSPLLADVGVSFLPKDLTDLLGSTGHVSDMIWSMSQPQAKIGEQVDVFGSFSTDLAGEQVAVEIFVPSTYKLLENITTKNKETPDEYGDRQPTPLPFTISDEHCRPTHFEARFDRLFLYYDSLEPGTCDISISAIKAYSGTAQVMPMRVAEMYKGLINGRKVILK